MDNFRVLVVHGSNTVSASLATTLEALGVPAETASEPSTAIDRMQTMVYGALVLDDALPKGGSLTVFVGLDELGERRPSVVMVTVPRAALAAARQAPTDRVEYVATPESESDTERLALRIRARLMSATVAAEFGADAPRAEDRQGLSAVFAGIGQQASRPYVAVAAVLVILLGLLFLLQQLGAQAGPLG